MSHKIITWQLSICSSKKKIPPLPPGISVIFQFVWVPPGKNISVKNAVAQYFYAKDILGIKRERKNIFIYVNTVSNNLSFAFLS